MHRLLRADGLPRELRARLANTSLAFMFVLVPGTRLEDVDGEMLVEAALDQFLRRLVDQPRLLAGQLAQFQIGAAPRPV